MDRTEFVLHVSDMSEIINVEASTSPSPPGGLRDERGDIERVIAMDKAREGSHNGSSPGHSPVLNLSKSGSGDRERTDRERGERGEGSASGRSSAASRRTPQPPRLSSAATAPSPRSHTDESDAALSDQDDHNVKDEDEGGDMSDGERDLQSANSPAPVSYAPQSGSPPSVPVDPSADTLVSSTETLLRNIQGLLKVAADNARQQERQISYEKEEKTRGWSHHQNLNINIAPRANCINKQNKMGNNNAIGQQKVPFLP
ncbi:unnamed protein product [Pieris macdunnoughi]|uniref:Dachshund n=1 Tax=Pieris macdunnoughi TaxID=345717 RepID=A0A821Y428_9NEOP|nr:unnamed protein product [Pieris macdunnoughi]